MIQRATILLAFFALSFACHATTISVKVEDQDNKPESVAYTAELRTALAQSGRYATPLTSPTTFRILISSATLEESRVPIKVVIVLLGAATARPDTYLFHFVVQNDLPPQQIIGSIDKWVQEYVHSNES